MGGFFYEDETKLRPDNYHRYKNTGAVQVAGAQNGIGAAVVTGNWGELNKAVTVEASDDYKKFVGSGNGLKVLEKMFLGGATTVKVVRVGTGGAKGTCTLKDTTASAAVDVLTLTAKYEGSRKLSVSVKESLVDESMKELVIYEGTDILESYKIIAGTDEVAQAVSALKNSAYVDAVSSKAGNGKLAVCAQKELTGGTDPTVTNAAYGTGFSALEAENWNSICVDTNDTAVHTLLQAFIDRIYEAGSYPLGTPSEASTVKLDDRIAHAAAFNDEKIQYLLNGWELADGTVVDGWLAAAQIAGMVAAIPANDSLTHKAIKGAVKVHEPLTNTQITKALQRGCLVISTSKATGQVRIEKGINTLISPSASQDAGWKKIRRVKTRFELMQRIDTAIDELNGAINNDEDGRSSIIAAGQAVLDAMVGEKKLLPGAEFKQDPSREPESDSAWFAIDADDLDSFEIGYLTYGFRFTQPSEE